jgi:hypothetical protein
MMTLVDAGFAGCATVTASRAFWCARAAAPENKNEEREETLIVFMQNLLDSPLLVFKWGICRC